MSGTQVKCGKCNAAVRVPGPGRYKCPKCGTALSVGGAAAATPQQLSTPAYLQQPAAAKQAPAGRPAKKSAVLPAWVVPLAAGTISFAIFAVIAFLAVSYIASDDSTNAEVAAQPQPAAVADPPAEEKKRDPRMFGVPDKLATDLARKVAFEISFMSGSRDPEAIARIDELMQTHENYVAGSLELDQENNRIIFEYVGPEFMARQFVDALESKSKIETRREPIFLGSRVAD